MKENSWREIALLMNVSCQNRWLRLRERFIREKRFRELETRSISRISRHTTFTLYKNMLFLDSHIKRRCYSNVTNSIAKIQKIH
ncbi:PREDICTED: uncharacterized protein LOC105145822 [Acromyrmex echinatior]|uniref:uncharacterized protein LOC105145822 n=1 Tax=Acromyrmex echinatior TaxID=103372 RepID=UPI000580EFCC|nr:PREDICTED: uncharacterized protein LOC105145822 [Acromyrmex echinatior]